jgi:DNA-binding response OmpR family regulator
VEDDRATHSALRIILGQRGWEVSVADTLSGGLAEMEALHSHLDCVLLDLMLPDGNGLTLFEELRSRRLPAGVIVTTGSNDPVILDQIKGLQPLAVFHKPINLTELLVYLGPLARLINESKTSL